MNKKFERMMLSLCIFGLLLLPVYIEADKKDRTLNENQFLEALKKTDYVIALFTSSDCDQVCQEYENSVRNIKEAAVYEFGEKRTATFVLENTQLARLYNPAPEPFLIFFRHGVPILYDGKPDVDQIYSFLTENKQPCVRKLTDENFEHLTQATTGATTGDWFIFFYGPGCVECQRMTARLETVCAALKRRLNVASIDISAGKEVAKQLRMIDVPGFIFLRHGIMYRYELTKYDPESLRSFAMNDFKNVEGEPIPPPATLREAFSDYLQTHPIESFIVHGLGIALILILCYKLMEALGFQSDFLFAQKDELKQQCKKKMRATVEKEM